MKKRLFTVCALSIILGSFSIDSAYASAGDFDDISIIPPVIIRPPADKQKMTSIEAFPFGKSTFVDRSCGA